MTSSKKPSEIEKFNPNNSFWLNCINNKQLVEAVALASCGFNPIIANAYRAASLFSSNKVELGIKTLSPIKIFPNNCLPLTGYLSTASSRIFAADYLRKKEYTNLNVVLGTSMAETLTSGVFDFWQNYKVSQGHIKKVGHKEAEKTRSIVKLSSPVVSRFFALSFFKNIPTTIAYVNFLNISDKLQNKEDTSPKIASIARDGFLSGATGGPGSYFVNAAARGYTVKEMVRNFANSYKTPQSLQSLLAVSTFKAIGVSAIYIQLFLGEKSRVAISKYLTEKESGRSH